MTYPHTRLFIAGEWQDAADGKTLAVFNPATGLEIGRVAHAGIPDLDRALAAAREAKIGLRDFGARAQAFMLSHARRLGVSDAMLFPLAGASQNRVLDLARKLLAKGEDVDAVLEALSRGLTQKMLHGTLAELRAGDAEMRAQTAQTVSRLFLRSQSKNGQ